MNRFGRHMAADGWIVNGCPFHAPAAKPGGDLLFQRLSGSTIGAERFHGRVRDGIGWGTLAMTTRLRRRRVGGVSMPPATGAGEAVT